jgi:hypothetical protein
VGPYKNEYVWFLRFDESGEKITEIVEFLDSKAAAEILSRSNEEGAGVMYLEAAIVTVCSTLQYFVQIYSRGVGYQPSMSP